MGRASPPTQDATVQRWKAAPLIIIHSKGLKGRAPSPSVALRHNFGRKISLVLRCSSVLPFISFSGSFLCHRMTQTEGGKDMSFLLSILLSCQKKNSSNLVSGARQKSNWRILTVHLVHFKKASSEVSSEGQRDADLLGFLLFLSLLQANTQRCSNLYFGH